MESLASFRYGNYALDGIGCIFPSLNGNAVYAHISYGEVIAAFFEFVAEEQNVFF